MEKIITLDEAVAKIHDGMTVMIGGFLGTGAPDLLVDKIIEKGLRNLTVVANDTSFPDKNIGKLVVEKNVSKVIISHIGTNPETGRQMNAGELDVVLVPQGTLAEQVRAAGAGLGGVLTPTGLGTIVEEGKEKVVVDGKTFILEKPIKADVSIIRASKVDTKGNCVFDKAARNFNPLMAMAADVVIVEADEIVEVGSIDPNYVMTPHIFVDYIVKGAK